MTRYESFQFQITQKYKHGWKDRMDDFPYDIQHVVPYIHSSYSCLILAQSSCYSLQGISTAIPWTQLCKCVMTYIIIPERCGLEFQCVIFKCTIVFSFISRAHCVNMPSQWEMVLHCNIVSHWLGAYIKWSLISISSSVVFRWMI